MGLGQEMMVQRCCALGTFWSVQTAQHGRRAGMGMQGLAHHPFYFAHSLPVFVPARCNCLPSADNLGRSPAPRITSNLSCVSRSAMWE